MKTIKFTLLLLMRIIGPYESNVLMIDTSNRECEREVKADFVYSGKQSEPNLTYF